MRQLVFRGNREFELVDAAEPDLGPDEVRIEVLAAGICGSDVHGYAGLNDRRPPGTVMGHEVVGRVVEAVAGVEEGTEAAIWPIVSCGECDACAAGQPHLCARRQLFGCTPDLPGGFAAQMVVPRDALVPLPAGVPAELGALVEPLAVGHHAVRVAGERLGGAVSVIGGGPIGIAAAIAAIRLGAERAVVVEPMEARRELLERFGLEAAPPERAPQGVDLAIECVGNGATIRAALAATRPGGTVVVVGVAEPEVSIPIVSLVIEERSLLGSSAYTRADFDEVAASLATTDFDLSVLIEARTDLAGAPAAFAAYADRETTAVKTLVVP